jgi:hypothetical protein
MRRISTISFCLALALTPASSSIAGSEALRSSPPQLNFGSRAVGTTHTGRVNIRNAGEESVVIFHVSLSSGFSIESLTCFDSLLDPRERSEIEVMFSPSSEGIHQGSISSIASRRIPSALGGLWAGAIHHDPCDEAGVCPIDSSSPIVGDGS